MKNMIQEINQKIEEQYHPGIAESLTDKNLFEIYQTHSSCKQKIKRMTEHLLSIGVEDPDKINQFIQMELKDGGLISPGLKGSIRGLKFNEKVKEFLLDVLRPNPNLVVAFEMQHPEYKCFEVPDFYIYDSLNKKLLIGMNQIDLWSGGAQWNRASKYVLDERYHSQTSESIVVKHVNIVCNLTKVKKNDKKIKLFQVGFEKQRLCYLHGLPRIIEEFFQ